MLYDLFDVRYFDLIFFEILNLGMYVIYNLNVEDNLVKMFVLFFDLCFVINECRQIYGFLEKKIIQD